MIIASYDADVLEQAFGIDMSGVEGLGTGAGWGRVAPGRAADRHQHDETELFVIVRGSGEFVLDSGERHPAEPGTVVLFEPFETHVLANTGEGDLVFFTQYWRDGDRALASAANPARKGFGERPVFVFSTPPTPNGDLHLGHLSGPYLGADAFTRFQRMTGAEAYHLTGSDDYQSYVVGAARKDGRTPAETAAHYSAEIAETLRLMDIPLDQYTVTDQDPAYREGLQDFFSRVVDSGRIAVTAHEALYDAESGQYLYEVDVKGGCPGCGATTSGNICEECGEPNTVADLTDPVSAASTTAPRRAPAARWTLPLHAFADDVRAHHRLGRVPARLRELADRLFRRPALDVPVTHPSTWGVEPQENATEGQVIWVWPEMSYGFLHGIQSLGSRLGRDWRAADPARDWKIVHFFGYDNSFYHAVLYPVLYKLAFPGWTPDIDYHVNEFYLLEGSKFSTSRRHAIWGKEILSPDTVDSVRYFLASTRPEGLRTDFRRAAYEATLDDTLIGTWQQWLNDLGARVAKHHGGHAPDAGNWTPEHSAFLARLGARLTAVTGALDNDAFSLNQAAAELDGIVRDTVRFARGEGLLADTGAWADENRTAIALELAAARLLAHAAAPVMPRFADKLAAALGLEAPRTWPRTVELLAPGTAVTLADAVFFRPAGAPRAPSALTPWLTGIVRSALRLEDDEQIAGRTLTQLAAGSLQAVTVQYQILDALDVDLSMDELLHGGTLDELAAVIAERADDTAVAALTEGEPR
ncbi:MULTISPECIES: class I tRNA ligase family protein [unclassified Streptomyces]|uniref:class I tRNA ligase family protein n=1 Tax=unclassified Streptomyces TaxID=2593676 RepID=UPI002E351216|nr:MULTISPECIES: class I tRNA ligase family protein [unclassified Streptomyces]WUC69036.1 class I tRNA ligase family protein [Streptomyces sp. NBC_00539]